jgi:hypothetical protein
MPPSNTPPPPNAPPQPPPLPLPKPLSQHPPLPSQHLIKGPVTFSLQNFGQNLFFACIEYLEHLPDILAFFVVQKKVSLGRGGGRISEGCQVPVISFSLLITSVDKAGIFRAQIFIEHIKTQ